MTNIHVEHVSLEDVSAHSDVISWKAVCEEVGNFRYPTWAACGQKAEAHANLKERISHCLWKYDYVSLDLDF
jgi:hypothetical protein